MLVDITTVFHEQNFHYWLDWGALLGLMRNGKLIEWDHDIDFGIFEHDIPKYNALRPHIEKKGYRFFDIKPDQFFSTDNFVPRIHLPVSYEHCHKVAACDIFIWTKLKKRWRNMAIMLNSHKFFYCGADVYENTEWLEFKGHKIRVPAHPAEYMTLRYGANWRVPDQGFGNPGTVGIA